MRDDAASRRPAGDQGGFRGRSVDSLMRRDFVTIGVEASLLEALQIMRTARLRHLLVERDGVLAGLLSYRRLVDEALDQQERGRQPTDARLRSQPVGNAMSDVLYVAAPSEPLSDAALRLCQLGLGCLPVVEESERGPNLVGLITETDLIRAAYASR